MNAVDTTAGLNRLYAMHNRSLAMYLTYASPTWHRGDEKAQQTMELMADDQRDTADRLAAAILEQGGTVSSGKYPMYYTGYHDLSFEFLLDELIKEQRQDIAELERSVDDLRMAPLAKALAEEALGAAKGHLQSLQELKQQAATP